MSKVLSFRLCEENPREAKALDILKKWREDGYSLRHKITDAILKLDDDQAPPQQNIIDDVFLDQLKQIIQALPDQNLINPSTSENALSHQFMSSLKMSVKPGVSID